MLQVSAFTNGIVAATTAGSMPIRCNNGSKTKIKTIKAGDKTSTR